MASTKTSLLFAAISTVLFTNQVGSEVLHRRTRDDGSFAAGFGGPVAQASGPEDSEVQMPNIGEGTNVKQPKSSNGKLPSVGVENHQTVLNANQNRPNEEQVNQIDKNKIESKSKPNDNSKHQSGPIQSSFLKCRFDKKDKQILAAVAFNKAGSSQLLSSTMCLTPDVCMQMCQGMPQCNYFIRSFYNSISYLYEVAADNLSTASYTESITYDSYVKICE